MSILSEQTSTPLLDRPVPFEYRCDRCFDSGLWFNYAGRIAPCPNSGGTWHPTSNAASIMLRRFLLDNGGAPSRMAFYFARALTHFTSERPCPTPEILEYMFGDTLLTHAVQLRKLAYAVEELRHVWRLPVGSRKGSPPSEGGVADALGGRGGSGYWIITDLEDCKQWLRHASAAPKTQLATIWRSAKAAFPVLAGQNEFSFMDGLEEGE